MQLILVSYQHNDHLPREAYIVVDNQGEVENKLLDFVDYTRQFNTVILSTKLIAVDDEEFKGAILVTGETK